MQSDYEGAAENAAKQHARKIEQWRVIFAKLREDVSTKKEKWMSKYSKLEEQLHQLKIVFI
jgi:septation ring formation regulator EzrA